jgi:hypothetical protein
VNVSNERHLRNPSPASGLQACAVLRALACRCPPERRTFGFCAASQLICRAQPRGRKRRRQHRDPSFFSVGWRPGRRPVGHGSHWSLGGQPIAVARSSISSIGLRVFRNTKARSHLEKLGLVRQRGGMQKADRLEIPSTLLGLKSLETSTGFHFSLVNPEQVYSPLNM